MDLLDVSFSHPVHPIRHLRLIRSKNEFILDRNVIEVRPSAQGDYGSAGRIVSLPSSPNTTLGIDSVKEWSYS